MVILDKNGRLHEATPEEAKFYENEFRNKSNESSMDDWIVDVEYRLALLELGLEA